MTHTIPSLFQKKFNLVIAVLVAISIILTILESTHTFNDPKIRETFMMIHVIILSVFTIEFIYRIVKAPHMYPELSPAEARKRFLFHPYAIIDIIVIMPLFFMIYSHSMQSDDMTVLRLLRFTSILNLFQFYRTSKVIPLLHHLSKDLWKELLVIGILSIQVILFSGVIMYYLEHGINPNLKNIFDGIWWAAVTLATIGYGDIFPYTTGGRFLGMFLGLVGVVLVALPTGILTSGFIRALRSEKKIEKLVDELEADDVEQEELAKKIHKIEKMLKEISEHHKQNVSHQTKQ